MAISLFPSSCPCPFLRRRAASAGRGGFRRFRRFSARRRPVAPTKARVLLRSSMAASEARATHRLVALTACLSAWYCFDRWLSRCRCAARAGGVLTARALRAVSVTVSLAGAATAVSCARRDCEIFCRAIVLLYASKPALDLPTAFTPSA